jgi:hypothetical protein
VKVGDLIRLDTSVRKNGRYSGKLGLIVGTDTWGGYIINIGGELKKFHTSQIAGIINEGR